MIIFRVKIMVSLFQPIHFNKKLEDGRFVSYLYFIFVFICPKCDRREQSLPWLVFRTITYLRSLDLADQRIREWSWLIVFTLGVIHMSQDLLSGGENILQRALTSWWRSGCCNWSAFSSPPSDMLINQGVIETWGGGVALANHRLPWATTITSTNAQSWTNILQHKESVKTKYTTSCQQQEEEKSMSFTMSATWFTFTTNPRWPPYLPPCRPPSPLSCRPPCPLHVGHHVHLHVGHHVHLHVGHHVHLGHLGHLF